MEKRILVIAILYNNTLTLPAEQYFYCSISLYVLMNVAGTISIDKNQFVPTV